MTIPVQYIASLISTVVTYICYLWISPSFVEWECQIKVYQHLKGVRVVHLMNLFFYGFLLGICLVHQEQSFLTTLAYAFPMVTIFTFFWVFLRRKMVLVKSRINVPSSSSSPALEDEGKDL